MKPIIMTPKDLDNYKNLSQQTQGKELLTSFMALENTYLPYDLGANVKITNVPFDNIANANGEYLTFWGHFRVSRFILP